jgi:hypothetical protein
MGSNEERLGPATVKEMWRKAARNGSSPVSLRIEREQRCSSCRCVKNGEGRRVTDFIVEEDHGGTRCAGASGGGWGQWCYSLCSTR